MRINNLTIVIQQITISSTVNLQSVQWMNQLTIEIINMRINIIKIISLNDTEKATIIQIITIRKKSMQFTISIDSLKASIQINFIRIIILIEINLKFTLSLSFFSKIFHINLKIFINTIKKNRTQVHLTFKNHRRFRRSFNHIYKKSFQNHQCRKILT